MKTLLSVLAGAALTVSALAIPQTFNQGGFFAAAGQPFEDFAGQVAAFGPGAEMKGKWAPVRGQKGAMKLELDAVVFGIPAKEIRAQKHENNVLSYSVVYSHDLEKKQGAQKSDLLTRVLAAISAYTGKSVKQQEKIDHKGVNILVGLGGNGDVHVTFSRAK
jgi:hypothetical protein